MRMVLIGAPGSGKGTQAQLIEKKYGTPQISTGDLLRQAVADGTPLGLQAKTAMDMGQLVSDDMVIGMIRDRISRPDANKGFILDGFPRNLVQAQALDQLLHLMNRPLHLVLLLETDFDALMQRITGRRTCRSCGHICNIYTDPPKMDGHCDECGGNLRHRVDDNEEIISNRFRVYEAQTTPAIAYYREQNKVRVVQGIGQEEDVFAAICQILDTVKVDPDEVPMPTLDELEQMIIEKSQEALIEKAGSEVAGVKQRPKQKSARTKPVIKATTKKQSGVKKKSAAKKVVVKKKTTAKKKGDTKKTAVRKKTGIKKTAPKKVANKKTGVKKVMPNKAAGKKKAVKKKVVKRKKAAVKKKSPARKKAVVKKKTARRKK
ncbi:MAG TPA: adenylate kinase [Gammaproteobacteria bacterium]|nr:adenylate kinase [Gammaproteobacteria bacterium]